MAEPLRYRLYQVYWSALDLLFPPTCGGCGKKGVGWCISCQAMAKKIEPPLCNICGQKLFGDEMCRRCEMRQPRYTALRSWAHFEGNLRNVIHQLKYRHNVGLGEKLSRPLMNLYQMMNWEVDMITPVPLGLARLAERGYNQSSLLAKPLSLAMNIPYCPQVIERSRETRTQVGLTVAERWLNVSGAFTAKSQWAKGRRLLVIDDVTTSGSTLDACADALFAAGALTVYGLTLARAVLKSPWLSDQPILDS